MTNAWQDLIKSTDQLIKSGRMRLAAQQLSEIKVKTIPREFRAELASLSRRCGRYTLGIRILATGLSFNSFTGEQPNSHERAEYGVLLLRAGAIREAQTILEAVPEKDYAQVLLYRSFCHFMTYEFAEAQPLLERYLASVKDPYVALLARINLINAFVELGLETQAHAHIEQFLKEADPQMHRRLISNCWGLKTKLAMDQNKMSDAVELLQKAQSIIDAAKTNDQNYLVKLKLFIKAKENRDTRVLDQYQKLAKATADWSGLRDSDFVRLQIDRSDMTFSKLYQGTPYPAYRQRLVDQFGQMVDSEGAPYFFGTHNGPAIKTIDLNGEGLVQAVYRGILKDLYRPQNTAGLFAEIFPGEKFDIFTSPNRVHQMVRRAKLELKDKKIGFSILCDARGHYRIRTRKDVKITISGSTPIVDSRNRLFQDVEDAVQESVVDFASLQQIAALSRTSLQRFILWAEAEGKIIRIGRGRLTRYKINSGMKNVA